ncbi:hypothetical protein L1987_25531 [Smallanthus sonchifolius]|uniref:Uncharacterized protein n=1 Tax=Smallanthus sonchifolius TaxID=185202 RepID=A0ACB9INN5_9ASTR|nr:hypothetical protein L1987_25531 [Smallanthus sonchifolius]
MEDHPNFILDCPSFYKQKSIEELTDSLWLTTMELQEEIRARDDRLNQLKHLLNDVVHERNEARTKCQSLVLDKLLLQHQFHNRRRQTTTAPPHSGVSCVEDEESSVSFSPNENAVQLPPMKGLPENGKFLEAVMKAGPLLQNLLLAGALPHWRRPPPPMDTYQIPSPPLVIPETKYQKKRGFSEDSDSSTETKYQIISLN